MKFYFVLRSNLDIPLQPTTFFWLKRVISYESLQDAYLFFNVLFKVGLRWIWKGVSRLLDEGGDECIWPCYLHYPRLFLRKRVIMKWKSQWPPQPIVTNSGKFFQNKCIIPCLKSWTCDLTNVERALNHWCYPAIHTLKISIALSKR